MRTVPRADGTGEGVAVFVAPHQDAALAEHEDAATRDLSALRKVGATSKLAARRQRAHRLGHRRRLRPVRDVHVRHVGAGRRAGRAGALHGKPYPGVEVRIVDDEGVELPPGMYGEICVRGLTVMDGYYKVAREEVFDADGFFHTRDAGRCSRPAPSTGRAVSPA